ncbi:GNAT family N-acetyltransferase [Flavihumibacter sp. CACIAM 22H1]|uniref:GNAT family N-acetyltransferase n=1 Tax=Flavihumibacter sp. CACIAM 22H1 TaxID=1812911 RepID=UPI0007A8B125|nr:GNAT family N-acetyltransferase [Flavihumibacter sp. CACIAM 22H1]KYP13458.1 MAG: acyl-CoA acyltransferase [Flavihumibacter sp. CACIAM 22H1]
MLVHHTQKGNKGVFYVGEDDAPLAELVYTKPAFDKMILEHTEVAEELKGQNIGYLLVETAVEYARTHQMKILPLCPFANAVFKKKPDYQDVLMA